MGGESDDAHVTGRATTTAPRPIPTPAPHISAAPTMPPSIAPAVPAPATPETGPLSWTRGQSNGKPSRPPRVGRPEPRLRQLMGVCGWAAVLGGIGLVIGLRGHIGILTGEPPSWYEPALITVGLVGIALTVGAFLTVHRRRAPWIFLGTSSVVLIVAMSLTSNAF